VTPSNRTRSTTILAQHILHQVSNGQGEVVYGIGFANDFLAFLSAIDREM
jgi:hypothetical protein